MDLRNLGALLRRLGERELARRLGITESTLRRWLKRGPSAKGLAALAGVWERSERSKKAAKTVKKQREFQRGLEPPEEQVDLEPEKTLPKRPPKESEKRGLKEYAKRGGEKAFESDRYIGSVISTNYDVSVLDVDLDSILDAALRLWQESGRTFCRIVFLWMRYVPFNPIYKGPMIKLQGKWLPWGTSTHILSVMRNIVAEAEYAFEAAVKAAATRMIFLSQVQVHLLDDATF